jgi:hypothetical protein
MRKYFVCQADYVRKILADLPIIKLGMNHIG